jgi:hypothetical protein
MEEDWSPGLSAVAPAQAGQISGWLKLEKNISVSHE